MAVHDFEGFVHSLELVRDESWKSDRYPYNLAAVRGWDRLHFHPKVTFFVGENGSGKSTLIEAIALNLGFNAEGGSKNFNFGTRESHSALHKSLRLAKSPRRAKNGYFLRAESFFNVATEIERLGVTDTHGGQSLHEMSHGESFMALLMHRFSGNGLYVLDEPEAALSPQRQLAFLSRLHDLVEDGAQFIIATHAPIMLGYPHATIYEFSDRGVEPVEFDELEHVKLTRNFLARRETFLDVLLSDD